MISSFFLWSSSLSSEIESLLDWSWSWSCLVMKVLSSSSLLRVMSFSLSCLSSSDSFCSMFLCLSSFYLTVVSREVMVIDES